MKSESHVGYVVYDTTNSCAVGIVSKDYKRKAYSSEIPRFIKESVVHIEDKRFYDHAGIDIRAILRALIVNLKEGKIVQGGSTITQQLARNLNFNNDRTLARKFQEIKDAFKLESKYTKKEILDLYFNNVYWGDNIYGIRSASLYYYAKEPHRLTCAEQLSLLTLLRGPNYYLNDLSIAKRRFLSLNNRLLRKSLSPKRHVKNTTYRIEIKKFPLLVFDNQSIGFLTQSINTHNKTIYSTLNVEIQRAVTNWVNNSKYPVTVICIEKGKVIAVNSTFGISHAFNFKSNVGSTLKPFIYSFLLANGFEKDELLSTENSNYIGWNVREVQSYNKSISLEDALFFSNNNAFINAGFKVGLDRLYAYLGFLLQKDIREFTPASILGATKSGISIFELANCYYNFFSRQSSSPVKDCYRVLNRIAVDRLGKSISNIFLKTGTTNDNLQRYAVLGNRDRVLAVLRGENPINDTTKEGNFLSNVKLLHDAVLNINKSYNKSYKWNRR